MLGHRVFVTVRLGSWTCKTQDRHEQKLLMNMDRWVEDTEKYNFKSTVNITHTKPPTLVKHTYIFSKGGRHEIYKA